MTKTRFSVVVDSAFRVLDQYPNATRFVIPVNDSVTNDYVSTPLMIFRWANPTNTISGTIVAGSQSVLILSDDLQVSLADYYTGCLVSLYNGLLLLESSLVTKYDPTNNSVTLQTGFTSSIQAFPDIKISYPDSTVNPYIVQATGYNPELIFEYSTLYLYNFTRKWIRPIRFINNYGLINLFEPFPISQYAVDDIFQIRSSLQILQFPIVSYYTSIVKYKIEMGSHFYAVGSYVYTLPDIPSGTRQLFQVKDKKSDGSLVLLTVEYGGPFGMSLFYPLYDEANPSVPVSALATIQVLQTRTVIDAMENPTPSPRDNVIYLGTQLTGNFLYYSYVVDGRYIILIDDTQPYDLIVDIDILPLNEREYGFLSRETVQCTMNVANFSIPDNQICTTVQLEYLILPNLPVKGVNKLLSFFPYVVVKLYNVDTSQYSRFGTITSNNPATANCQFICPIGNLLNPTIIKFVEVTSDMIQTLKISPYKDLYFEVVLPDGTLLEYEPSPPPSLFTNSNFSIRDTVACIFTFTI
jgi:hypothetical protein